jgi:hypothetical protein
MGRRPRQDARKMKVRMIGSEIFRMPVVDQRFPAVTIQDRVVVRGQADSPRTQRRVIRPGETITQADEEGDAVAPEATVE